MTAAKDVLDLYLAHLPQVLGLDGVVLEREVQFHPTRRWRFDYAYPALMIAVEYDGIMGGGPSHSSLAGILRDTEKINEAQRLGWRVFRANAKHLGNGTFYTLFDAVMRQEQGR